MEKVKKFFTKNDSSPTEATAFSPEFTELPSLGWSNRIQGFVICFVLGFVLSTLGIATLFLPNGITRFALLYTAGNIFSICSTLFLMGPFQQIKKMFNETRYLATLGVFAFMVLTIVSAIKTKKLLCLIFCILEFLSMTWYSISYIPFARDAVKKTLTTII